MKGLSTPKIEGKFSLRASTRAELVIGRGSSCRRNIAGPASRLERPVLLSHKALAWHSRDGRAAAPAECLLACAREITRFDRKQFGASAGANS